MRASWRRAAICVTVLLLATGAGCSWFPGRRPAPKESVAVPPADPQPAFAEPLPDHDVQSAAAARGACANYTAVTQDAPFPRDAILRGIEAGEATVRFRVDGTTLRVLVVRSSNPAFGDAAEEMVRRLRCRVDRPTDFEVPFSWRTAR